MFPSIPATLRTKRVVKMALRRVKFPAEIQTYLNTNGCSQQTYPSLSWISPSVANLSRILSWTPSYERQLNLNQMYREQFCAQANEIPSTSIDCYYAMFPVRGLVAILTENNIPTSSRNGNHAQFSLVFEEPLLSTAH